MHWRPGRAGTPVLVNPGLDAAARAAGARYGYVRAGAGAGGSVTVFLTRRRQPHDRRLQLRVRYSAGLRGGLTWP